MNKTVNLDLSIFYDDHDRITGGGFDFLLRRCPSAFFENHCPYLALFLVRSLSRDLPGVLFVRLAGREASHSNQDLRLCAIADNLFRTKQ
jgi:hypothetical protein